MSSIMALGLDLSGNLLFDPVDEESFVETLTGALAQNSGSIQNLAQMTSRGVSFKGEMDRETVDPGDPVNAGWTYLVNEDDPLFKDYARIIRPLAEHRRMGDPQAPLLYHGEAADEWLDWITGHYMGLLLEGKKVPQYILILGSPDQVPFGFQAVLGTMAKVGRLAFDSPQGLDELDTYVKKILRLEKAAGPVVTREALLFAPDAGHPDPTFYSREYMVEPISAHIRDTLGFKTRTYLAYEATRENFVRALSTSNPAMVYTASHGLGETSKSEGFQRKYNGSICCQHAGKLTLDGLFSAEDVPMDQPFLEGAAFFQFACFGYGTPAESDYAHWNLDVPAYKNRIDFIAALPQKLLAHPRGPIAYLGHLDMAFLHAFADAKEPASLDRWHARIVPFVSAVEKLLGVQPAGFSLQEMSNRFNVSNAVLTNTYNDEKRGKLTWTSSRRTRFLDTWIIRNDARNYMVFGDPGARLRIPAGSTTSR